MQPFANLLDCLTTTPSRNGKLALLVEYFRKAPDPDRGFALAALTDGLFPRLPLRRALGELMADKIDPVLYQLSRDYVGDTAETVSLLWPDRRAGRPSPRLAEVVAALELAPRNNVAPIIGDFLDRLDVRGRWALLKLIGGAPRVGVSARLAKTALAQMSGHELSDIEEMWHAVSPPYADLFAWLDNRGPRPNAEGKPVFRPLMLSHPIEEGDWAGLDPDAISAEWKWDGVRVQIAAGRRRSAHLLALGRRHLGRLPGDRRRLPAVRRGARRRIARRARRRRGAVQRSAAAPQPQDHHRQDAARLPRFRTPLRHPHRRRRGRAPPPLRAAARCVSKPGTRSITRASPTSAPSCRSRTSRTSTNCGAARAKPASRA